MRQITENYSNPERLCAGWEGARRPLRFQPDAHRMRKDGFTNGKPAYSCGDCRRRYAPDGAYRRPDAAVKQ